MDCIPLVKRSKRVDFWLIRRLLGTRAGLLSALLSFRKCKLSADQIERCIYEGSNLGITLYKPGYAILDFDENDSLQVFRNEHPEIADHTPVTQTYRGCHIHLIIKDRSLRTGKLTRDGKIIGDIKTDGYIAVPPSIHPSGQTYTWIPGQSPLDLPFIEIESLKDIGLGIAQPERLPLGISSTLRAIFRISIRDIWWRAVWRLGIFQESTDQDATEV